MHHVKVHPKKVRADVVEMVWSASNDDLLPDTGTGYTRCRGFCLLSMLASSTGMKVP